MRILRRMGRLSARTAGGQTSGKTAFFMSHTKMPILEIIVLPIPGSKIRGIMTIFTRQTCAAG